MNLILALKFDNINILTILAILLDTLCCCYILIFIKNSSIQLTH